MANGDDANDLQVKANLMFGSPMGMAPDLFGAHQVMSTLQNAWDIISGPSKVLSGELQPTMTPGPNQLSIPEYATNLALTGLGVRGVVGGAAGVPEGALPSFPAFHGTGAWPFREFSNEKIGSGEGAQMEGWGHYVAGAKGTAQTYQQKFASGGPVPLDEKGVPMGYQDIIKNYYNPGQIVPDGPSWGGGYAKVLKFGGDEYYGKGKWGTAVQPVQLDESHPGVQALRASGGVGDATAMSNPDFWKPLDGTKGIPRVHSNFPTNQEMARVGAARGWNMGGSGGLLDVTVKPDEHELLNLDAPWKDQHPQVQERLTNAEMSPYHLDSRYHPVPDPANPNIDPDMMTGRELYRGLVRRDAEANADPFHGPDFGVSKRNISENMDNAGVPGLRYLDQGSRNLPVGDPARTSNYVVFDPGNLDIKTWDGVPMSVMEHAK